MTDWLARQHTRSPKAKSICQLGSLFLKGKRGSWGRKRRDKANNKRRNIRQVRKEKHKDAKNRNALCHAQHQHPSKRSPYYFPSYFVYTVYTFVVIFFSLSFTRQQPIEFNIFRNRIFRFKLCPLANVSWNVLFICFDLLENGRSTRHWYYTQRVGIHERRKMWNYISEEKGCLD